MAHPRAPPVYLVIRQGQLCGGKTSRCRLSPAHAADAEDTTIGPV